MCRYYSLDADHSDDVLNGSTLFPSYFHDGRLLTLEDVVEFFNVIGGTYLTEPEKNLTMFLRAFVKMSFINSRKVRA